MKNIINFVGFQLCWLICVLAAARGLPWVGPVVVMLWVLIHLSMHRTQYKSESILLLFAALLGYVIDSSLLLLGYISFPEHAVLGYPTSLWMVALWVNLATTLHHSLDWLNRRYVLISLFGGIGGGIAYYAGSKLGAIVLSDTIISSIAVFCSWFVALPLLYGFMNKLDKFLFTNIETQLVSANLKEKAHV